MASYRYQRGDRPLDGYTIEHAVGRGGFGEVYFALSDSGRQVALKAVQNYEDIELRGISHCMNLKSPHLVSIFDVKHSDQGDPFVIMEYVSGPSLRELLDESPEGLGEDKAAWFIREISKAVTALHDNGIVHRDLKPHNVFFEDGYVKVGDYSLSKVITTSHRSGHTLTVGTVHYMAPEIGLGRYDRTVDIYALGVLLYEMLTGKPPFVGETMGEVLMKHMSQEVDVTSLGEPYASVVLKAMARDPEQRYQTPDELVEALFGADAVRDGASGFEPGSLTVIARRAVENARPLPETIGRDRPVTPVRDSATRQDVNQSLERRQPQSAATGPTRKKTHPDTPAYWMGQLASRMGVWLGTRNYPIPAPSWKDADELSWTLRLSLSIAVLMAGSFGTAVLCDLAGADWQPWDVDELALEACIMAGSIVGGSAAATWLLSLGRIPLPWFVIRGIYFGAAGILGFIASNIIQEIGGRSETLFVTLLMPLLLQDWRWMSSSARCLRVRLAPSLTAAFIGAVGAAAMVDGDAFLCGIGIPATACLAVQVLCPFSERRSRRMAHSADWFESFTGLVESEGNPSDNKASAPGDSLKEFVGGASGAIVASAPSSDSSNQGNAFATSEEMSGQFLDSDEMAQLFTGSEDESNSDTVAATLPDEPPPARMPALVLSLIPVMSLGMLPFFGLHRFYAGKFYTGLLYLATGGLFGVGQIIDVVLIALGEFRDEHGRLLSTWRSTPDESVVSGQMVNSLSSIPSPKHLLSSGLAFFGALVLTLDVVLGFLLAIGGPQIIESDLLEPLGLSERFMSNVLSMTNWSPLLFDVWATFCGVLSAAAAGLLITSRARHGVFHMLRVVPAGFALGACFSLLMEATRSIKWDDVSRAVHREEIGPALDAILSARQISLAIPAAVVFCGALFILAWPPRKQPVVMADPVQIPVTQRR